MNNEIFVDITDTIIPGVCPYYKVSNYGKIISTKVNNKEIGSFINAEQRVKCSLSLLNGKSRYIDAAKLIYCTFNRDINMNDIVVMFKDLNPHNLKLDNLYFILKNELTAKSIENRLKTFNKTNQEISSASYHIKSKKIMCHYVDEVWLDITSVEIPNIQPYYMISNYGRVYNKAYDSIIYPQISYNGYMYFVAKSTYNRQINVSIHRTELKCFNPLGNYDDIEANHIDCNTFNNKLYNLEWLKCDDNNHYTPEKITNQELFYRKFTYEEINKICKLLENGYGYLNICYILGYKYTGVMHKRLTDIHRRITYTNISKNYKF